MIVVTNGLLIKDDFISVMAKVIEKYKPNAVYLREKHLDDKEYFETANALKKLLNGARTELFVSHRLHIAKELGINNFHISFNDLCKVRRSEFEQISVAVHNISEAEIAKEWGADKLVYGHIFDTDCKPNIEPRGLDMLMEITKQVALPIIAIGGINADNYKRVLECGASDFAIMSSAMKLQF